MSKQSNVSAAKSRRKKKGVLESLLNDNFDYLMPWTHMNTGNETYCHDEFGLNATIEGFSRDKYENNTPIVNGTYK